MDSVDALVIVTGLVVVAVVVVSADDDAYVELSAVTGIAVVDDVVRPEIAPVVFEKFNIAGRTSLTNLSNASEHFNL